MEVRNGIEISVLKANWQAHTANTMVRADLSMPALQDKVDIQDRIWTHSLGRYSAFFWCGIEPRPSIQPIASNDTHRAIAILWLEGRPVIWQGNEGRGLRSRYLKLRLVLPWGLAPHILNTRSGLATSFRFFFSYLATDYLGDVFKVIATTQIQFMGITHSTLQMSTLFVKTSLNKPKLLLLLLGRCDIQN
jgi:hypothetical protein